jgi:hypothetical protein
MNVEIQNKRTKAKQKISAKLADFLVKKDPKKYRLVKPKFQPKQATYQTKDMVAK